MDIKISFSEAVYFRLDKADCKLEMELIHLSLVSQSISKE